jgi:hypothetical protein
MWRMLMFAGWSPNIFLEKKMTDLHPLPFDFINFPVTPLPCKLSWIDTTDCCCLLFWVPQLVVKIKKNQNFPNSSYLLKDLIIFELQVHFWFFILSPSVEGCKSIGFSLVVNMNQSCGTLLCALQTANQFKPRFKFFQDNAGSLRKILNYRTS